ncbi:MAG: twin-arginine translocase TatA/TatE family subunit [Vicinamibacteria bacterium]|nr:twin-arginine translocase TatA/TatE family subunit [Vicinamibacteria bacterium]
MFGTLGGPELILIFIVGLVVFGPRKLPEIGKSLGKMMGEFRRASADFQRTIEDEVETEKLRKDISSAQYPGSEPAELPGTSAVVAAPATAPLIRGAEGSIPSSTPLASAALTSGADISGDTFSGNDEKSASS